MDYFSLELSADEGAKIWKFIPVRPILPFSLEVIIQALAPVFGDPAPQKFLHAPAERFLIESLQAIGLKLKEQENRVAIFEIGPLPVHPFTHDAGEYISYCKVRESYFAGISNSPLLAGKAKEVSAKPPSNGNYARTENNFDKIIGSRKSASRFTASDENVRDSIELILQDCYYRRHDGHLPYASAGGFPVIGVMVVYGGRVFDVNSESREWTPKSPDFDNAKIHAIGFNQDWILNASFWLIPYVKLGEPAQKYGARAYRFGLIAAGGFLHQAGLSAYSVGFGSRILGGFDDIGAEVLTGFTPSTMDFIVALIGFGKADQS
jgi:hypothetical protein